MSKREATCICTLNSQVCHFSSRVLGEGRGSQQGPCESKSTGPSSPRSLQKLKLPGLRSKQHRKGISSSLPTHIHTHTPWQAVRSCYSPECPLHLPLLEVTAPLSPASGKGPTQCKDNPSHDSTLHNESRNQSNLLVNTHCVPGRGSNRVSLGNQAP